MEFKDGMKVVFIDRGRKRFLPFSEIRMICPVEWSDPHFPIKGLFIETNYPYHGILDFIHAKISENEYAIISDVKKTPFDKLIPAMKKALGGKWISVYRGDLYLCYRTGKIEKR